jgi:apolipoprotein N-acyltransferase
MQRIPLPLAALAAGAASAFAFQPVGWWPLMILAIAALCEMVARAESMKKALLIGWAFGLGQFVISLNWIATAFTFQAKMPPSLGWVAVVLLSLYLAIYPAMAAGLAWRFGEKNRLALVLALAGGWAITEWLRATMFTGFSWNPIAVTLVDTPLRDASTVLGTYGLSVLVTLIGSALWLLARRAWKPAAATITAIVLLGVSTLSIQVTQPSGPRRDIRVVQPNIGQQDKWRPGFEDEAYRRLYALTIKGPPKTRMIFWPEAAVTEPLEDGRAGAEHYTEAERLRATRPLLADDVLLTGGLSFTSSDGQTVDGATNSVYLLQQIGKIRGRYDKAHLVPYGEYLPMRPVLSAIGLSRLAPGDIDFADGPGPRTIQLPGDWGKVGFQLCYEIIFSGQVVDRKSRPDFIFNPSNDAWFGRWGPPQHLAQARLRAAEEGLPVIRSTPTGISALIDPHGRVVQSLPWQTAGIIDATMPGPLKPTPFARFGNIIPLTLGFLLLIAAIALDRRARYRAI